MNHAIPYMKSSILRCTAIGEEKYNKRFIKDIICSKPYISCLSRGE